MSASVVKAILRDLAKKRQKLDAWFGRQDADVIQRNLAAQHARFDLQDPLPWPVYEGDYQI